jgi:hypothetical protein
LLHPVVAALLMMASSLLVAWSSGNLGALGNCHSATAGVPRDRRTMFLACSHALALALQGPLIAMLLGLAETHAHWTLAAFVILGCAVGWLWHQWEAIPHSLDMTIGMATFANLGMMLGWWADLGFGPAKSCACGCGATPHGIGMWIGMLCLGNLIMAFGMRRPLASESATLCRWAMFGGGNIGMIFGMLAAGNQFSPQQYGPAGHLLAMSVGMTVGMLAGHFLTFSFHTCVGPAQNSWPDERYSTQAGKGDTTTPSAMAPAASFPWNSPASCWLRLVGTRVALDKRVSRRRHELGRKS